MLSLETKTSNTVYDITNIVANILAHPQQYEIRKTVFPGMAIPMLKIRRPSGRLIFNMEIAIRR